MAQRPATERELLPFELGPRGRGYRDWLTYHNYEVPVPLEYWRSGASLTPDHTIGRVTQMRAFQDLFNSDFLYNTAPTVPVPLWKEAVMFWANLVMQYEPEIDESVRDIVSPRFLQMLNVALKEMFIDGLRFGTGLLHLYEGDYGAEIVRALPIYYMPGPGGISVLIEPSPVPDGPIDLFVSYPDGRWERRRYKSGGGLLGEVEEGESGSYGESALWDLIGENNLGRVGTLLNVPFPPDTGDWGSSLLRDCSGPIIEMLRQYGQNSEALSFHGKARKVAIAREGESPSPLLFGGEDAPADALLEYDDMADTLVDWYDRDIIVMPGEIAEWKGDYFEGSLEAQMTQIKFSQEQYFATTKIPEFWFRFTERGSLPMSGAALKLQARPTYTQLMDYQNIGKRAIKKALMVGAIIEGASATDLQRIADTEVLVAWHNVFDEDETRNVVTEGDGDTGTDIPEEGSPDELAENE